MSEEQREVVAQATYAAYVTWHVNRYQNTTHPTWQELDGLTREMYRRMAETAYGAIKATEESRDEQNFILDVLRLFSLDETDGYDYLFWRCKEPGTVEFFVNVNDVFWWATADLEKITSEDLPNIRQAVADVESIVPRERYGTGFELWAARKRKMRPQQPAYPKDERLRALFDACGPVRTPAEEG